MSSAFFQHLFYCQHERANRGAEKHICLGVFPSTGPAKLQKNISLRTRVEANLPTE